jgi:hypothetical protein
VAEAKKPRIRKARVRKAPTLREQAELALSKAEQIKNRGALKASSLKNRQCA